MTTATKAQKTPRYTKAQKDAKKTAQRKKLTQNAIRVSKGKDEPSEPKKHQGKHPAIENGGETPISESVGCHFRVKAGTPAPVAGDLVLVKTGRHEVVLLVKHVQQAVNADTIVFAFTGLAQGEKEQPAYQILAQQKGKIARVFWN